MIRIRSLSSRCWRGWYNKNRPAFWIAVLITMLGAYRVLPRFTVLDITEEEPMFNGFALLFFLGPIIIPAGYLGNFASQIDRIGMTEFYTQPGLLTYVLAITLLIIFGLVIGEVIQFVFRLKRTWVRIPFVILLGLTCPIVFGLSLQGIDLNHASGPYEETCDTPMTGKRIFQVFGTNYDNGFVTVSDDDGKTWTRLLYTPNSIGCWNIEIVDENTFTVQTWKEAVSTTDGGKTWQVQEE